MDIFKRRLASKSEYFQLFLICAFPIHVWAILNLLYSAPAMALQMNVIQLLSVVAYVGAYALFESLLLFALLFLGSVLLPERFFRAKLIPIGAILVFFVSLSAMLIHLYTSWRIAVIRFPYWVGLWVAFGLAAAALMAGWVSRNRGLEGAIRSGVERLALLSLVYLSIDLLGVVVILARNLD